MPSLADNAHRASNASFATVHVGAEAKPFVIHESLLVHQSDFFRAALTGKFAEAEKKMVVLQEESCRVFELFVHWLYTERFPCESQNDDPELVKLYSGICSCPRPTWSLIELYVFGDKYMIPKLKKDTLNELFSHTHSSHDLPSAIATKLAFKNLQREDPLCRLLIDLHCRGNYSTIGGTERSVIDTDVWPAKFVSGVLKRYADIVSDLRRGRLVLRWELILCDYHEHKTSDERNACRNHGKGANGGEVKIK